MPVSIRNMVLSSTIVWTRLASPGNKITEISSSETSSPVDAIQHSLNRELGVSITITVELARTSTRRGQVFPAFVSQLPKVRLVFQEFRLRFASMYAESGPFPGNVNPIVPGKLNRPSSSGLPQPKVRGWALLRLHPCHSP